MSIRRIVIGLALICLALPAQAGPTRYNPRRSGHPLRIAAYALHPVGVIVDTLIFHPAWWIGQHEPFHTLFGVQTQIDDGSELRVAQSQPDADIEDGSTPPAPEPEPEPDQE